jgi:hypothetical protein
MRRRAIRFGVSLAIAAGAASSALTGGCYRRTISASGPGAVHENIQESDQQNWLIDDLLLGEQPKRKSSRSGRE